ncbi:hypothetical protein B0H11DRAFT_2261110 [Mycena galericulata]|nr:hypothetical protein B0H11DRAFT_2261110 [Mycena galericulata]
MARTKTGKAPGRVSDFSGEKKTWLETFRDLLVEAGSDPGPVYTDVTNLFLLRYGFDLPFAQNVEGDPKDNPPPAGETVSPEEKARRDEIRAKLRVKLANWYRNRYKGKKVHAGTIKQILLSMHSMTGRGARPRRKPAVVMYSKLHYATRVKPGFDEKWAAAKETTPHNFRVSMSRDYVRSCWEKESKDFRKAVEDEAEETHLKELKEWRASRTVPEQSAEQAHENLNDVGIPLADALAERLGAQVVILVVGPVGSEGGEVCLRTVFSDTSNSATPRTWAQFDHKGFSAMEASITRYGRAAFTKAECQSRAWPPVDGAIPPAPEGLLSMNDGAASGPAVGSKQPTAATALPNTTTSSGAAAGPAPTTSSGAAAGLAPTSGPEGVLPAVVEDEHNDENINDDPPADDGLDRSEWSESLVGAHAYLSKKNWGSDWEALVQSLVNFEWSHYHHEDNGKLPKGQCRPDEFAQWMKEHRPFIDYRVQEGFGARLLAWWKELGPPTRWDGVGDKEGEEKEPTCDWKRFWVGEWSRLTSTGRNGPMLLILGLAWWGQTIWNAGAADGLGGSDAALAAAGDWKLLVKDVHGVITAKLTQGRAAMEAEEDAEMEEPEEQTAGTGEETAGTGKTGGTKRGKGNGKKKAKGKVGPAKPKAKAAGPTRKRKRGADEEEEAQDPPGAKSQKKKGEGEEEGNVRPRPRRMTRESARARLALGVGEMSSATTTSDIATTVPEITAVAVVDSSGNAVGNTAVAEGITASKNTPPGATANSAGSPLVISAVVLATADSGNKEATGPVPTDEDDVEESQLRSKSVDPAEIDPFADLEGLTAEERAEMELDPDADLEDDDDEEE